MLEECTGDKFGYIYKIKMPLSSSLNAQRAISVFKNWMKFVIYNCQGIATYNKEFLGLVFTVFAISIGTVR